MQALFEGAEENYAIINGLRDDAERELKNCKKDHQIESEKMKSQKSNGNAY
jgi:hypothetical protein